MEEKPGFLPASSRPGRVPALPMPRTLRDPDTFGAKRVAGSGKRFPVSLRINLFEKARWLGRRVSQSFRRPRVSLVQGVPTQQVHSETKHYGLTPYRMPSGYSETEGSQYADTVVHNRLWENQSYVTSLDNQEDYFSRASPSASDGVSPSVPIRTAVETIPEDEEPEPAREGQRGFTPFTRPTNLNGVDSRRVYSALMKNLTEKFSTRGPANETIEEEAESQDEEPQPNRPFNENSRPPSSRVPIDKSPENRKPLSEIVPRTNNTITVIEEEDDPGVPPTPVINITGVKGIRSDDALFSQIAQQHEVWQEEAAGGSSDEAVTVAALRQLSISNVEKEKEDMTGQRYRTASGKLQENKVKDGEESETDESEKMKEDGMESVFI
ncbi:hypothetical protein TWF718_007291 [Orbilia javanica]|uniref:Uncharacterized protein n=1 Tax=Orbilia javanica TaxID=47235 RepID=A0AAN8N2P2_9PEZI